MPTSTSRLEAIKTASARTPRFADRVLNSEGSVASIQEAFGANTFGLDQLRKRLSSEQVSAFLNTCEVGTALDPELADAIASAASDWAQGRGATHFCHWFQPMTGATAEKHDAFLDFDGDKAIARLTGSQLIQSEPDASSFPSGGMRTTFEARGYTAWDPTSPMFLNESPSGLTLCIPSCFISYHGDALDKKTPLLRSMEALSDEASALLNKLGNDNASRVVATAGPEQEYFLIDKAYVALRPDLVVAGRTLLGARPPKGQSLDDHYFGSIPSRAMAFMHELDSELYKMGVPAKTRHNEVAPSQFEIAVVFSEANRAADHNQLVMELLSRVAERHNFVALMHEKPFDGINGSGKHLNWSLQTQEGSNLLNPGATPEQNLRFLSFLSAIVLSVHRHSKLLRSAIATHGNDFRLGANEAPPAIVSVFLGHRLTEICDALSEGRDVAAMSSSDTIELGVPTVPQLEKDNTDRNRTSPFAFTGNKFEFRALGSSSSVSFPLTVLNTAVADGIRQFNAWVDEAGGGETAIVAAIKKALVESNPVRFEGDNYSDEWVFEAERRGLPHLRNTPVALEALREGAALKLFTNHKVLSEAELQSRYNVKVEQYITTVDIEADALRGIVDQMVLPAALAERTAAAIDLKSVLDLADHAMSADLARTRARYEDLCQRIAALHASRGDLDSSLKAAADLHEADQAAHYGTTVVPALARVRVACDALEEVISNERWMLPRYSEMLFQH